MTILPRWNASPHGIIDRAITLSADKSTPHGSARHKLLLWADIDILDLCELLGVSH